MTKQEEEVVSFAATPKGFVREVHEEEKETPKDEVKPEPSARKLGSFATVLGALNPRKKPIAPIPAPATPVDPAPMSTEVVGAPTAVTAVLPETSYQDNSFDELIAILDASHGRAREMDATMKQVRADQKWERDHALEIQSEIWRRIHALGIKEPVQPSSAPLAHTKAVAPPKVVTPPKPRKEKNSGKANEKKDAMAEALHDMDKVEEQQSIPAPS